jgi:flagellar motor switch protein FliM
MGKLLSQEEVDALLKGLSDGDIVTETPDAPNKAAAAPYDFFSRDLILDGHMPTMEIVNEKFTRASTASLFQLMGKMIDVTVEGFEIVKYEEFLRKLPEKASFDVYRQDPFRGSCLFFFEAKLISLVVDILFGGSGKLPVDFLGRDFTTMESRVIQRLLNMCFQDLEKAWSIVGGTSFHHLRSETNPQFVNLVQPSDLVMASRFKVNLDLDQAVMGYCIPFASLEPIKDQLYGRAPSEDAEADQAWKESLSEHLRAIPVDMSTELGTSEITFRDLLNLKEDDILPMNVGPKDPMVLRIQEVQKGTCVAGQRNGNYAIEVLSIDETLSKEKRSGAARGAETFRGRAGDPLDRSIFTGDPAGAARKAAGTAT